MQGNNMPDTSSRRSSRLKGASPNNTMSMQLQIANSHAIKMHNKIKTLEKELRDATTKIQQLQAESREKSLDCLRTYQLWVNKHHQCERDRITLEGVLQRIQKKILLANKNKQNWKNNIRQNIVFTASRNHSGF